MSNLYVPQKKVVIASSFEGIVNDGAPECALTSLNAYHNQNPDAFLGRKLDASEFSKEYTDTTLVRMFLALRPMVKVAEDYHTVLELIRRHPGNVENYLQNPNTFNYEVLEDLFDEIKSATGEQRDEFGKGRQSSFYKERAALQEADYDAWSNTQRPYEDTLPQFRALVDTQVIEDGQVVRGFVPAFATSKDEASTYELCVLYSRVRKLEPGDLEGNRCLISRDRIIGIDTVPSKDKVEQLAVLSDRLGVPREYVWRLNDMVDEAEEQKLRDAGFVHQFFLPGYATPMQIEQAKKNSGVVFLERTNFAETIAEYSRRYNF